MWAAQVPSSLFCQECVLNSPPRNYAYCYKKKVEDLAAWPLHQIEDYNKIQLLDITLAIS